MSKDSAAKKPKAARRRPLWKKLLMWLCRAAVLLVLLVVALVMLLPSITDTDFVKGRVTATAGRILNDAVVELETLRLAPLSGRLLVVEGLRVAPPGQADRPLLTVDQAVCEWNPSDLLDRKLLLTDVRVSGVQVRLEEREGAWNFASLIPAAPPEAPEREFRMPDLTAISVPLSVEIAGVTVKDVTVRLERENGDQVEVGPLSLSAFARLDNQLKGAAALWCDVESVSARLPGPFAGEVETRITGHAFLLRNDAEQVSLQAELSTQGGRAIVMGFACELPPSTDSVFRASIDLAGPGIPDACASFTVPGALEDELAFRITPGQQWRVWADNSLLVDLEALSPAVEDALIDVLSRTELASKVDLGALSLDGSVHLRSVLAAELSIGPPVRADVLLDNHVTGDALGFAARLRVHGPEDQALDLVTDVRGLDVLWHYAAQLALADGLTVHTTDGFSLGAEAVELEALGLARLECRDVFLSGTAADSLPEPVDVAVCAALDVGSLSAASPLFGRVETPLALNVNVHGRNLRDLAGSVVILEDVSGSVGPAVPHFRLQGLAEGYGFESLCLGGGAAVGFGDVLGLADGLADRFKAMVVGLQVQGLGETNVEVAGSLAQAGSGAGLEVCFAAAAVLPETAFWRAGTGGSLADLYAELAGGVTMGPGYRLLSARGSVGAETGPVTAAAGQAATSLRSAAFAMSATSDLERLDVSCDLQGAVHGLTAATPLGEDGDTLEAGPFDVEAGASIRANIPAAMRGDLTVERFHLAVPGVVALSDAMLRLEGFGARHVAFEAVLDAADLSSVVDLVPRPFRELMPALSGGAKLWCEADGSIPPVAHVVAALREGTPPQTVKEHLLSSLLTGGPWPELRLFPLRMFYQNAVPLAASGGLELRGVSARHRVRPGLSVALADLSGRTDVRVRDGNLAGEFAFELPELTLSPVPFPLERFLLSGRCGLSEFDRFHIQDIAFSAFNGIVTCVADGEVSGLASLRPVPSPASLLSDLSASLDGRLQVEPNAINALAGWRAEGGAGADLSVELVGRESLRMAGVARLDELGVVREGLFSVQGLTGRVPYSKDWRIVTPQQVEGGQLLSLRLLGGPVGDAGGSGSEARQETAAAWKDRGFAIALDRLLEPVDSITVRSVSALGHEVLKDVGINVRLEGETVRVPRLTLGMLGGQMVARMGAWRAGNAYEIYAESEFDGLDVRQMLPPHLRDIKGDSSMSGNMRAEMSLRLPGAEGEQPVVNPIKEVSARLTVTHIGPEALDRALLLVDPKAENPNIVQMRGRLGLASPRRGYAELRRGFVSGEVELQGLVSGLVDGYALPRFSIVQAFASARAGRYLSRFAEMMSRSRIALDAVGADDILLREDRIEFLRPGVEARQVASPE